MTLSSNDDLTAEAKAWDNRELDPKDWEDAPEAVPNNETIEKLAAYAHEAWAGWMKYMFEKSQRVVVDECGCLTTAQEGAFAQVLIPADLVKRWERQMNTPYADLPENEKESDRVEARKMLDIFAVR